MKNNTEILLSEGQEVILEGKKYTMRRLNTKDVFSFAKLVYKAIRSVGNVDVKDPDAVGLIMMAGMADFDEDICGFYANLIGMDVNEFMAQPPEFFSAFMDELQQHYDLSAFYKAVLKAVKSLGSLWSGLSI